MENIPFQLTPEYFEMQLQISIQQLQMEMMKQQLEFATWQNRMWLRIEAQQRQFQAQADIYHAGRSN